MKKNLIFSILSLIALPSLANASSNNFDGFYVGLGFGGIQEIFEVKNAFTSDITAIPLSVRQSKDISITKQSPIGNINLGYSGLINNWNFLALEAHANFYSIKGNGNVNLRAITSGIPTTLLNEKISITQKTPSYGIAIKPGLILSPNTAFYALAGVEMAKFEVRSHSDFYQVSIGLTSTANADGNTTSTKYGLLLGAGIETYIMEKLKFGLEYNYINFGTIKSPYIVGNFAGASAGTLTVNDKIFAQSSALLLKLTYQM